MTNAAEKTMTLAETIRRFAPHWTPQDRANALRELAAGMLEHVAQLRRDGYTVSITQAYRVEDSSVEFPLDITVWREVRTMENL